MDGVPGVSVCLKCLIQKPVLANTFQQCPIAPGQSFTYSFIADLYGTSKFENHIVMLGPLDG